MLFNSIANTIMENYKLNEDSEVMDFACGTGMHTQGSCFHPNSRLLVPGLVSRPIAPHVKSILGVDISQGMVDVFNKRATTNSIGNIKAVAVDILEGKETLDGKRFDVIIVSR